MPPSPSSTTGGFAGTISRVQVRGVALTGSQELDFVVPDGASRLVIENAIGPSSVRMGLYYNFVRGRIEAWLTYVMRLREGTHLQVGASDVIGLGRLYLDEKSIERSQTVPIGIGQTLSFGAFLVNLHRTYWQLTPLETPSARDSGQIDAVGVEFTGGGVTPDLVEVLRLDATRKEQTRVRFRHAFRGMGGDYHFDRVDADIRAWVRGVRRDDEVLLRVMGGQAYNVTPSLPLREGFGLGGIDALKGYRDGEFRGRGVALAGTEYAFRLPWHFAVSMLRLDAEEISLLGFAEAGRIQDRWARGETPFLWSAGGGLRIRGMLFKRSRSTFRLYAAQAEAYPGGKRSPVFYATVNIE